MGQPIAVGILGVRGIGKHHAKWFDKCGCDVVSVYGRTPESCERAEEALRGIFDFHGEVTSDWERFVLDPRMRAVSVCSPAEVHVEQVVALLRAGKDVLCEKPLFWDWERTPQEIVDAARSMVAAARASGRILAVNAQYPAGAPHYLDLFRRLRGRDPSFETLNFVMETKGKARSEHDAEVWIDLGPHALALLDALLPGGTIDPAGDRMSAAPREVIYEFLWVTPGRRSRVKFELRRVTGDAIARRFGADGLLAEYAGRNQDGEFVAVLDAGEAEWVGEDFMRSSIRRFVEAVQRREADRVLVSGEAGLRHLEEQVKVWDRHWRTGSAKNDGARGPSHSS
jgi:predicted dehydrogenase